MNYSTLLGVALALGITPAALWAAEQPMHSAADAQTQNATDPAPRPYETRKTVADDNSIQDREDRVTPRGLLRASELINHGVYNNEDEQVGKIYDVVLDTNNGAIKYVAVSTGGFLGLGDALHAVPWQALKCEVRDGEQVCVLNVDTETFKEAKGFDQDNWPNMADRNWQQSNDRQYRSTTSIR